MGHGASSPRRDGATSPGFKQPSHQNPVQENSSSSQVESKSRTSVATPNNSTGLAPTTQGNTEHGVKPKQNSELQTELHDSKESALVNASGAGHFKDCVAVDERKHTADLVGTLQASVVGADTDGRSLNHDINPSASAKEVLESPQVSIVTTGSGQIKKYKRKQSRTLKPEEINVCAHGRELIGLLISL